MLYIGYLITANGQYTKQKPVLGISIFELPRLENYISRLCPSPLGTPLKHPNRVKNTQRGLKHALHRIFHQCPNLILHPFLID